MFDEFKNPSNQYRSIPFWFWNSKLDKDELKYQIKEMKKARLGGYFMHARSGLKTEYLSEEWFDCIKTGIEAGKEAGLDVWAYDEEGWPSGFAGGIVPSLSADYYAKFMSLENYSTTDEIDFDNMIAVYIYNKESNTYEMMHERTDYKCADNEELLAIRRNENPFYIDTLNKRAVDAFIKVTHEEYYKRFGDEFGKTVKGFFTDEPRLTCDRFLDLPWSDDLPTAFMENYGYCLEDNIPKLYLEVEDYKKVRYDFWSLVSYLFVHNYMKNIYDWCDAHNVQATGHVMMEESIFSQMTSTAGVMPFYEYEHIPGIDWLRRPIASPVIAKQVGSAACQLGKKKVLTESYALCGWDVSFEELKWIAEWQFVNGVNLICQHAQDYTLKGVCKRDYPPSLFIQQTWWNDYNKFMDYLGRLCVVLSQGNQTADVLLIHPMHSGYILYDGTRSDEMRLLDDKFTEASETLSGKHISYHFGDETIIRNHGSVNGDTFVVGEISYKTVILPQMYAIDGRTLELLLEFIDNGGTVLSMGRFPDFTNGDMSKLAVLESKVIKTDKENVRAKMAEKKLLALSVSENGNEVMSISYQQRQTPDGTILFLVNHNQTETYNTTVTILGRSCKVKRMIAETGEVEDISFNAGDDTTTELTFEPMQSYILLLEDTNKGDSFVKEEIPAQIVELKDNFKIEKMDNNSFTLDMCRYSIDGGEWQGPVATIKLQGILLDLQRPCDVKMSFDFNVKADVNKMKEFFVVIEDAHLYDIEVNGQKVVYDASLGYWKDKSFNKVDIKSAVKEGKNEILLTTKFQQPQKVYDVLYGENVYETEKNKITYDMEIENIYLLGDFGVVSETPFTKSERKAIITEGPFVITECPTEINSKDFATNGFLFFAGSMTVSQKVNITKEEGKRVILALGKQNAPLIKVYVNGKFVKDSFWAPYDIDITEAAVDGENEITLEVYASNRNLFGPHHNINGECYNVGPESYTGKWSWVERKSEADATDIYDTEKDYWTDTYCFVEFGLQLK